MKEGKTGHHGLWWLRAVGAGSYGARHSGHHGVVVAAASLKGSADGRSRGERERERERWMS